MSVSIIDSFIDHGGRRMGVDRRNLDQKPFQRDRRKVADRRSGSDRRDLRRLEIRKSEERRELFIAI